MDSSRRAVESYWRSRMIDGATSDEDKVTPVYKLEEICDLLRSSHVNIVKEFSEFILKRLDHKSPTVKQKALRLIKYAVGKSGVEFRREMQRHSVALRQLFHYKGQLDPLKGDALNKAVRDTAHEAISAIFAEEDKKPAPAEDLNRRIQGFGNTNFKMPSEDKKSFLSEVVGLGSASIKQGLSNISQAHSLRKNDNGSYKSPNLRRSLTTEMDYPDRHERVEHHSETQESSGISRNVAAGPWGQDLRVNKGTTNGDSSSSSMGSKSQEERLLETIVTSGGVRLQPTRDAIQVFLADALKLDAVAMSHALESKLQSHLWQVRMRAVCVLESILRKKDDPHFSIVTAYFSENNDVVTRCSESPQASLREKANKVLSLLDGEDTARANRHPEQPSSVKADMATFVQMPDLIDTGDSDDYYGKEDSTQKQSDQSVTNLMTSTTPLIDDLFGDNLVTSGSTSGHKNEDDPFADVSFHTTDDREHVDDLFLGMRIDDKQAANEPYTSAKKNGPELFDIFGPNSEQLLKEPTNQKKDVQVLMAGLSIHEKAPEINQKGSFSGSLYEATFSDRDIQPSYQVTNDASNGIFGSQPAGMNSNDMFPRGFMPYHIPPNFMFNPAFVPQPINYGVKGSFIAQPQLLATMPNLQHPGNLSTQGTAGVGHAAGNFMEGGYPFPHPDIFNPNIPTQSPGTMMNSSKKEETRAFDFISDHLSAARNPKRVV